MTLSVSGTNGVLRSYDYQTPSTGFSYTFPTGTQVLLMNPTSTLLTGTVTMPSAPSDGMTITLSSSQAITTLTLSPNTGQSILNAITTLAVNGFASYIYRSANTTWYRVG